jgi:hypothetical protein
MSKRQAEDLHREAIVIDGLNASYFFNESVLGASGKGASPPSTAPLLRGIPFHETMNLIADYYRLFEDHKPTSSCRCAPRETFTGSQRAEAAPG